MKPGYIYVMSSNSWQASTYKVGFSADPDRRAKELFTTGLPHPIDLELTVQVADMVGAESAIHSRLREMGLHANKEFFVGDLEAIVEVVRDIAEPIPVVTAVPTPAGHRSMLMGAMDSLIRGQMPANSAIALVGLSAEVHKSIDQEYRMRREMVQSQLDQPLITSMVESPMLIEGEVLTDD